MKKKRLGWVPAHAVLRIEELETENARLIRKVEQLEEQLWFERLQQQRMAQQRACANGNGLHR